MCTCVAVGFFFRTRHIAHLRNGEPRNLGAASRQHPWCERMFLLFVSQFIVVMQRSAFLGANADNKGICRTSWFRLEIYSETEIGFFFVSFSFHSATFFFSRRIVGIVVVVQMESMLNINRKCCACDDVCTRCRSSPFSSTLNCAHIQFSMLAPIANAFAIRMPIHCSVRSTSVTVSV